jgi:hypothetical protein
VVCGEVFPDWPCYARAASRVRLRAPCILRNVERARADAHGRARRCLLLWRVQLAETAPPRTGTAVAISRALALQRERRPPEVRQAPPRAKRQAQPRRARAAQGVVVPVARDRGAVAQGKSAPRRAQHRTEAAGPRTRGTVSMCHRIFAFATTPTRRMGRRRARRASSVVSRPKRRVSAPIKRRVKPGFRSVPSACRRAHRPKQLLVGAGYGAGRGQRRAGCLHQPSSEPCWCPDLALPENPARRSQLRLSERLATRCETVPLWRDRQSNSQLGFVLCAVFEVARRSCRVARDACLVLGRVLVSRVRHLG